MFTSATGYIFSFGLSRRRHDPPFKPGGSVGALVGRPGLRAGFARIRARGRGRGSVGQHAAAGKSLWIAICNPATISLVCVCALSRMAASPRGRPVFPLLCVSTDTWRRAARIPTRLAPPPLCPPAPRKRTGGDTGLDQRPRLALALRHRGPQKKRKNWIGRLHVWAK